MVKISAVVITYNEEKNIERCISALQKVADEIVVVDSYSTDKTVGICEKLGCEVSQNAFKGYGSQKQYAVDKTVNNWMLVIDADEVLSDKLIDEIKSFKENDAVKHQAYFLRFSTFYLGKFLKFSGLRKEKHLRLFNKKYGRFSDQEIHEGVIVSGSVGILKNKVLHYTLDPEMNSG